MLVFGKISPDDLIQNPSNPGFFKYENIGASAKDHRSAAEYMNTLEDLAQKLSQQKRRQNGKETKEFRDYNLRNYFIDDGKILVEYYKKQGASGIVQAYVSGIETLTGVTDEMLSHFEKLATSLKDEKLWQNTSVQSRAPVHSPNQAVIQEAEKLRKIWEEAEKKRENHNTPNMDTQICQACEQAWSTYCKYGAEHFNDLDENAQKALLSSASIVDDFHGLFRVSANLKNKFIPVVNSLLQKTSSTSFHLLNRDQNQAPEFFQYFLTDNASKEMPSQFMTTLKDKKEIQEIYLDQIKINQDMIDLFRSKKNLKKLRFLACIFDDQAADQFLKILPTLENLEQIYENDCKLPQSKAKAFRTAIQDYAPFAIDYNESNQSISIRDGMFENEKVLERMRKKMQEVSQEESPKHFFYGLFSAIFFTAQALKNMLSILPDTLISVYLNQCIIDQQGFQVLLQWLKQKTAIKDLTIRVTEAVATEDLEQLEEIFKDRGSDAEPAYVCVYGSSNANQYLPIYRLPKLKFY